MPGANQIQEGSTPLWFLQSLTDEEWNSFCAKSNVEQDVPHNFVATWLICNLQLRRGEGPMPLPGRVQCNLVTWSWDFVARVTRPSSDPHCLHCTAMVHGWCCVTKNGKFYAEQTCDAMQDNS